MAGRWRPVARRHQARFGNVIVNVVPVSVDELT
jgi:hypothetical protein